ncbi:MAG: hypothetical protein QG670_1689 [Thermoproteota archaeon]|nr:hypothetical protein [Thermoproteota archaeon]
MFKNISDRIRASGKENEIMKYVRGINFPISKQNLISALKNNNAPSEVISTLDKLPEMTYNSPQDLVNALKGKP